MTESYIGAVDRIVDGKTAVILLEEDGEVIEQLNVPVEQLPDEAQEGGAILEVTVDDGDFVNAEYLAAETNQRKETARERLDRLSKPLSEKDE